MSRSKKIELELLEELFLDQLEFRILAVIKLLRIGKSERRALLHYLDELSVITRDTISLLHPPA